MVFLEGPPYDQERSIYFDGLRADYAKDDTKLTLLALHNEYKDDRGTLLADEERRLRRGETGVLGAYMTQKMTEKCSIDLYGFLGDIDDDDPTTAEAQPNHPLDENAALQVLGARAFGALNAETDASLEVARQFGDMGVSDADMSGWMLDARLTLKQLAKQPMAPVVELEYTYMSGDDPDTDEFEGWHPVFAEYPIWREELFPLKVFGNWTNMHKVRAGVKLSLNGKTSLSIAGATIHADEENTALVAGVTPDGSHVGELLNAFLDYKLLPNMTVSLEACQFYPGDHLPDTQNAEWLRLQTVYTF